MTQRRTYVSLLIAAAVVWLSACGATPPSTDTPSDGGAAAFEPNVIAGVLADGAGTPLAGQQVSVAVMPATASVSTLTAAEAQRASVALTDEAGRFRVPVTVEGTYGIGNVGDTTGAFGTVVVERGSDGALRQTSAVTLSTAPLGAITGTVDGPGPGVFVFALGTSFSAVTDATGAFSISRVPAGTYQVVAGTPGNVTAQRAVTVVAGEVATIAAPIVFGPRVTGVDPEGFVTPDIDFDLGGVLVSPRTFTISGSGFGASQGLSIVRYARMNVDAAIDSWSDSTIVIDVQRLEYAFYEAALTWLGAGAPAEAFHFEVITAAGASASTPVGIVATWLEPDYYGDEAPASSDTRLGLGAVTFWGGFIEGVSYTIDVTNGQALSSDDGSLVDVITTGPADPLWWRPYTATFDVRQSSGLPAIVTVDPSAHPLFADVQPTTFAAFSLEFHLDWAEFVDDTLSITGSLFGWDGEPMPDDGGFTLVVDPWSLDSVTFAIEIEPDGTFVASGSSPSSWIGGEWIDVRLLYQGFELIWNSVEVLE